MVNRITDYITDTALDPIEYSAGLWNSGWAAGLGQFV